MKIRGFEIVKKYKNSGINLPKRMTKNAAGYDIESAETIEIAPGEIRLVATGIKVFMRDDEVFYIYDRSSNPRKLGAVLANSVGIIDADYYNNAENEGAIFVQLKNIREEIVKIEKGTRIAQGIFAKILLADDDESKTKLSRTGGFGSTK